MKTLESILESILEELKTANAQQRASNELMQAALEGRKPAKRTKAQPETPAPAPTATSITGIAPVSSEHQQHVDIQVAVAEKIVETPPAESVSTSTATTTIETTSAVDPDATISGTPVEAELRNIIRDLQAATADLPNFKKQYEELRKSYGIEKLPQLKLVVADAFKSAILSLN